MDDFKFIDLFFKKGSNQRELSPEEKEVARKLEGFLARLLMRIYSSTSLIVYLHDAGVTESDDVELVFHKLPPEVVPQVLTLIGVRETKTFQFRDDDGHLYHGFKLKPSDDLLEPLE